MPRQTVGESAIYGQGEIREAVVAALVVVALVVVMVSLPMILCLQIVQFWRLLKRRNLRTDGRTDGRTDLRTDPLIEMRGRI